MKIEITFYNEENERTTESKTIVFDIPNDNPMLLEGNSITDILGNDPVYQSAKENFEFWYWEELDEEIETYIQERWIKKQLSK